MRTVYEKLQTLVVEDKGTRYEFCLHSNGGELRMTSKDSKQPMLHIMVPIEIMLVKIILGVKE